MVHICISEMDQHCFWKWFVVSLAPCDYLSKYCEMDHQGKISCEILFNFQNYSSKNAVESIICELLAILFCPQFAEWNINVIAYGFPQACEALNATSLMGQIGLVKIKDHDACLALCIQPCKFNIRVSQIGRLYVGLARKLLSRSFIRKCCGLDMFHIFCRKCCKTALDELMT